MYVGKGQSGSRLVRGDLGLCVSRAKAKGTRHRGRLRSVALVLPRKRLVSECWSICLAQDPLDGTGFKAGREYERLEVRTTLWDVHLHLLVCLRIVCQSR